MSTLDLVVFPLTLITAFILGVTAGLHKIETCQNCDELSERVEELTLENERLVDSIEQLKVHIEKQCTLMMNFEDHMKTD